MNIFSVEAKVACLVMVFCGSGEKAKYKKPWDKIKLSGEMHGHATKCKNFFFVKKFSGG